CARGNENFDYW
nr:immunoglobulin heavy chain junction region [Macaca mulatta]MOW24336.1 immunoglobulin heavy chain junction region [Macaca mulatta]MOW24688.1 immunoglobulin heavy chain junction region [Macaca mulatta]MOW24758.1 immunoglobulin heavy chain junction region [Macaca mulatta]MOW24962.1 immunoglobulin heavy chain junction region [Macaca mulatta]